MPVTVGGLIAGAFTALAEGAGAIAPEAVAAADVGAGVAADVGAGAAVALPEITVTAADTAAAAGAGTEAALAGGTAAFADPTAAALAGEGVAAGTQAGVTGADVATALAGGAGALTAPITAGVPSGAGAGAGAVTGAAATPSDVLSGTQLASLGTSDVPVTGGGGGGGIGGATDVFANAPTATPNQIPFSTAYNLMNPEVPGGPGTNVSLPWATASPTPVGTQIAPENIPASATLSQYEGNIATEANPNVGGQFGEPAPVAGTTGTAASGLSSALRTAGLLAPLGALGLTLARGQPGVSPATQTALNQTAPFSSYASSQLAAASANQVTPAQAALIATYKQNAQNQLFQLYAREGRDPTNDTDYIQGLAQIDANALGMQQQYIQDMVNNAIAAQGVSDSVLQTAANEQVANDNNFQTALNSSLQSFGLVAAINTIGTKAA